MKSSQQPEWLHVGSAISLAVFVLLAALVPFAALAILTVSDTGFSADAQLNIDTTASILIGNASSTGITIGKSNTTTAFPGIVGIGTSTPSSTVVIQGSSTGSDLFDIASSTGASLLHVSATGNVGIGTIDPFTPLEVERDQNQPTFLSVANLTAGDSAQAGVLLSSDSTQGGLSMASSIFDGGDGFGHVLADWAGRLSLYTLSGGGINVAAFSGDIRFLTGSDIPPAERMRIDTNGNVGIGTNTPSTTLQVAGVSPTIRIGASALSGCLELGNSNGSAGINYVTALNGVLTATTTKPSACQ